MKKVIKAVISTPESPLDTMLSEVMVANHWLGLRILGVFLQSDNESTASKVAKRLNVNVDAVSATLTFLHYVGVVRSDDNMEGTYVVTEYGNKLYYLIISTIERS